MKTLSNGVTKPFIGCPELAFQYFRHSQIKCIISGGKIKTKSYIIGTKGKIGFIEKLNIIILASTQSSDFCITFLPHIPNFFNTTRHLTIFFLQFILNYLKLFDTLYPLTPSYLTLCSFDNKPGTIT
jgi:hypothetical protein